MVRSFNHFRVIGHVRLPDGRFVDRVMSVCTRDTFDQTYDKAKQIISKDPLEEVVNFSVRPCAAPVAEAPSEIMQSEEPAEVIQHPGSRWQQAIANAAAATAAYVAAGRPQPPRHPDQRPLPLNSAPAVKEEVVVLAPPEGVVRLDFEEPAVSLLTATEEETEVCFE